MEPSATAVVAAAAENYQRLCKTCQMEFKVTEGRQHGSAFECTTCSSADRLLRRQLGDKSQLQKLSKEEQVAFFKQLHAEKEKRDGKLNWETVKAQLITSLTTKQITENSTNVNTKFLPLGVYLNKGWPKEVVEACPSEYSDTYGCWTYKVPVKSQDWKVVNQEIRERILVQERQATAVRGKKKPRAKLARKMMGSWICLRLHLRLERKMRIPRRKKRRRQSSRQAPRRRTKHSTRRCKCLQRRMWAS